MKNTSVTCVLVGSETYNRKWVGYEIMKSMSVGNHIFAVHINSIKDKNKKTKKNGPNPFYYLGYSFSKDGNTMNFHDYIDKKWIKYPDLGSYSVAQVDEKYRNRIYRLSSDYNVYDWNDDNGYDNFIDWVNN